MTPPTTIPPSRPPARVAFDGRLPAPATVTVETTRHCNLECRMCLPFLSGSTKAGPHLPLDVFRVYAERLFPWITWFQPTSTGEPLLSKGFAEMVRTAHHWGVRLDVTSNGTLLSGDVIRLLLPTLAAMVISCDGATAATFESIRRGARFDEVMRNVRTLAEAARRLPSEERPRLAFACTLMERNARELPELVRLAAALGLDNVDAGHVYPWREALRRESLAHHPELLEDVVAGAVEAAEETGIALSVRPLDAVTIAAAMEGGRRIPGETRPMRRVEVNLERLRPLPMLSSRRADHAEVRERRRRAAAVSPFPEQAAADPAPPADGPVWVCDFLWKRAIVGIEGGVRTCCVDGSPVTGILHSEQPFQEIWNGPVYRAMRQRLVARDPVALCRGCGYIRELTDPVEIDRWLQGRRVPAPDELEDVPDVLEAEHLGRDPDLRDSPLAWPWPGWPEDREPDHRSVPASEPAPLLAWPAPRGGRFRLDISTDAFRTIVWSSGDARPLEGSSFRLPDDAWRRAAADVPHRWRVILLNGGAGRLIWQGILEKTSELPGHAPSQDAEG